MDHNDHFAHSSRPRTVIDGLLTTQWNLLGTWLHQAGVPDNLDRPSVLVGWTLRDLIAHVGRAVAVLRDAQPCHDQRAQSVLQYVSGYRPAAAAITEGTHELAIDLGDQVVPGVDAMAQDGLQALDSLQTEVVLGPRGPIGRNDFVATRLVELVVHADDLARSMPDIPGPPIDQEALTFTAELLSAAYLEKTGTQRNEQIDAHQWVRIASGRADSSDDALPLL